MKPLDEDPFYIRLSDEKQKAIDEITEFINHPCQYAELDGFPEVSLTTAKNRYVFACRNLKVSFDVDIRTSQGKIIACKRPEFYKKVKKDIYGDCKSIEFIEADKGADR